MPPTTMLSPAALALSENVASQTSKQYCERCGIFDLYGRILDPAGIMWSVVILSPTLRVSSAEISSSIGFPTGNSFIFGPLSISTFAASSSASGGTIALSSIVNLSGTETSLTEDTHIGSPDAASNGFVIYPVSADATAVSGDTRYTFASFVPDRPSKFLLNVLRDTPPEFGENPMPMHGPHAHSRTRAPDAMISESAPVSESILSTCFDPGDMERLTDGSIVFPLSIAATFSISNSEELVHDPMHT